MIIYKSCTPLYLFLLVLSLLNEDTWARPSTTTTVLRTDVKPEQTLKIVNSYTILRRDEELNEENAICHPAGACEPCPAEEMNEPYCQPFGNRRLLHCVSSTAIPNIEHEVPPLDPSLEDGNAHRNSSFSNSPPHHPGRPPPANMPAWESCGRLVPKERGDFFEFVLCNVIFSALALTGVLIRTERMRSVRAKRLALRIGVGIRRASSNSWAAMGGMGAVLAPVRPGTAEEGERLMGPDI